MKISQTKKTRPRRKGREGCVRLDTSPKGQDSNNSSCPRQITCSSNTVDNTEYINNPIKKKALPSAFAVLLHLTRFASHGRGGTATPLLPRAVLVLVNSPALLTSYRNSTTPPSPPLSADDTTPTIPQFFAPSLGDPAPPAPTANASPVAAAIAHSRCPPPSVAPFPPHPPPPPRPPPPSCRPPQA